MGLIGGGVALLALALAAYLFASGDSLAAIKVMLVLLLVPGLAVFAVPGAELVRHPNGTGESVTWQGSCSCGGQYLS